MKNSLNKNLTDLSPRDIELSKSSNVNLEESDLTDIKKQNLRLNFEEIFAKFGFDIDANFKKYSLLFAIF